MPICSARTLSLQPLQHSRLYIINQNIQGKKEITLNKNNDIAIFVKNIFFLKIFLFLFIEFLEQEYFSKIKS